MKLHRRLLTAIVSLFATFAMSAADSSPSSAAAASAAKPAHEFAYLGGGCFWCLEAVFELKPGVVDVVSGYAGGFVKNPTYRQVCDGDTGHAEIVRIEYDPAKVSFGDLLKLFWSIHDPTSLNRQGHDEGTQYRSAIFYTSDAQRDAAQAAIAAAQPAYKRKIVTEVVKLEKFYEAEEYHQDYFRRNPTQGYCQAVIAPKVAHAREELKK